MSENSRPPPLMHRFAKAIAGRLSATDRCVALSIAAYCNGAGECWVTHTRLAEDCSLSRATITRSVGRLLALSVVERIEGGRGRGHASRYRLKGITTAPLSNGKGLTSNAKRAHTAREKGSPVSPQEELRGLEEGDAARRDSGGVTEPQRARNLAGVAALRRQVRKL